MLDQALIAIQGPTASAALATLFPSVATMRFMDATSIHMQDAVCFITRSGYTGEDGFEISAPAACIGVIAERLLEHITVKLAGIGARDSLRLEAGLCLYGQDLGVDTTPVEAALQWAIPPVRRTGGARAGGFPGAQRILSELTNGPQRRRVGLRPELRPVREGAALFADCASDGPVGHVTSGSFGPSINSPIAMAYVPSVLTQVGTRLFAEVRGQRTPVVVSPLPFVAHRYFR
jgi:aminomethyltransferase